jgi:cytochrome c peroxidase
VKRALLTVLAAAGLALPQASRGGGRDADVEAALARQSKVGAFRRPSTAGSKEVALGRKMFYDPRLSSGGKMSCSTCHSPSRRFSDGLPRALGRDGKPVSRNTPSLLTALFHSDQFWDGRAATIEEAALIAIQNPAEMAEPLPALAAKLAAVPAYAAAFDEAYPGVGITSTTIGRAFGAYVISLAAPADSPFDRFLADRTGLSSAAVRGFLVFAKKAECLYCHSSTNFNYNGRYQNIGMNPGKFEDPGRYAVEPTADMWGAFRVPSLRNVAETAPYMHDGRFATLREVIDYYDRGGDGTRYQDAAIKPLKLTAREKDDLLAFLGSLTSSTRNPEEAPR